MITVNHECYVSLEVAKLLKEAGFKWFINSAYRDGILMHQKNLLCDDFNGKRYENTSHYEFFSAPTFEVAQRWLREVKGVDINILVESISNHKQYLVSIWFNISDKSAYDNAVLDNRYNIYEKAQEAAIKKALEMILEKGE